MPNFAERLDRGEIDAILAYLKTSWSASIRAYQASLILGVEAPPQAPSPWLLGGLRDVVEPGRRAG